MYWSILEKFFKFGIVGASGMLVDFGITYLFKERLKTNLYAANTLGFISAASCNYLLNRVWTFQNQDPGIVSQYSRFFVVSLIGLLLNNGIIYILVERLKVNFYVAKLVAIGLVLFWNFFANYVYTFR